MLTDVNLRENSAGTLEACGNAPSLWEVRQRAYFFGQSKVHERVEVYEAILQVASMIYGDDESKSGADENSFKIRNLSIAYKHFRPLSEYAKKRREYLKEKRSKK